MPSMRPNPKSGRKDFADTAPPVRSENEVHLVMNAQLETILRWYLVLVPEGQDVPLETELPALGLIR
jgi:hypothetical protein